MRTLCGNNTGNQNNKNFRETKLHNLQFQDGSYGRTMDITGYGDIFKNRDILGFKVTIRDTRIFVI